VDFDDKTTVVDSKGDAFRYVNDICLEGYQKSNMVAHNRADLAYGVLVRSIPTQCDGLLARTIDVGGNVAASQLIAVPNQAATDEFLDFEDGQLPPTGWTKVTSAGGSGTIVSIDASAGHSGARGLLCMDDSTTEASTQRAGIEYPLPPGRFEWRAEGWFNPTRLSLGPGQAVYLIYLLSGNRLSVAARIHNNADMFRVGLVARGSDDTLRAKDGPATIDLGAWRKWRLEILRLATRETTAILYLNGVGSMSEQVRLDWDSTAHEPSSLRFGIGFSSLGAAATILADELRLTESELLL
jgi:hypothetical protein